MPWRTNVGSRPWGSSGRGSSDAGSLERLDQDVRSEPEVKAEPGTSRAVPDDLGLFGGTDFDLCSEGCDVQSVQGKDVDQPCSPGALDTFDRNASSNPRDGVSPTDLGMPSGPVVDNSNLSQLLADCFSRQHRPAQILMPWESGVQAEIFVTPKAGGAITLPSESGNVDWVKLVDGFPHDDACRKVGDSLAPPAVKLTGAMFEKVVNAISDTSFAEQRQRKLEIAVSKWQNVLGFFPEHSETGRQILCIAAGPSYRAEADEIVKCVLGTRSHNTAITRANALQRFLNWTLECQCDSPPFTEVFAWNYVMHLKSSGAAATSGASFISACRYAHHVFGFEGLAAVCNSRRIQGATDLLYQGKRFLKQAKILSVLNVRWLHEQVTRDDVVAFDKALYGFALICIYGRCRHSDLSFVDSVEHDWDSQGGFFEIRTSHHKTSRSVRQKTQLLPIVIPATGITNRVWIADVERVFAQVGLSLRGKINGPILRPPSSIQAGGLCERGLTSGEMTKLLRYCFETQTSGADEGEPRCSSHSLKATSLSWAAKFGTNPADQAVLGRHTSAYTETSAVYSRDASIRAVSHFIQVLKAIADDSFRPDLPRSMYWNPDKARMDNEAESNQVWVHVVKDEEELQCKSESLSADAQHVVQPVVVNDVVLVDDSSDASDTSSDSTDDSDSDEVEPPRKSLRKALNHEDFMFVKHLGSKLVHYLDPIMNCRATKVLACGKQLTARFERTNDTVGFCRTCKMKAIRDGNLS